jgi:hypothetical protein
MYTDLILPPGQYRNGTDMQSAGRWRDGNLVRWHEGTMQPVGGWRQRTEFEGKCRGCVAWRDEIRERRIAAGTADALKVSTGGGVVYDITPAGLVAGLVDARLNTGFGGGYFGSGTYGTARPDNGNYTEATTWSLSAWGQHLLACSVADGKIYQWELDGAVPAAQLSNAPVDNLGVFVTAERFVFALGASGDPRQIKWSDREDNTEWAPATTNEAGDYRLETNGQIMCATAVPGQTLILTDREAFRAEYQGPPFVYGFERVGSECGAISRQAVASVGSQAIWKGRNGFFAYLGGGVEPIPSEVSDYVFSDMNMAQASKVAAVANEQFNEVWWFYPSAASIENDRYVAYNYAEGHWSTGEMARTTGADQGAFRYPLWFGADGFVYDQEVGQITGAEPFAESGPLRMGQGNGVFSATQFIPDEKTQGQVQLTFKSRLYPNADEAEAGPFSAAEPTNIRVTGRQIRLQVSGVANTDWRFGAPSILVQQRGRR